MSCNCGKTPCRCPKMDSAPQRAYIDKCTDCDPCKPCDSMVKICSFVVANIEEGQTYRNSFVYNQQDDAVYYISDDGTPTRFGASPMFINAFDPEERSIPRQTVYDFMNNRAYIYNPEGDYKTIALGVNPSGDDAYDVTKWFDGGTFTVAQYNELRQAIAAGSRLVASYPEDEEGALVSVEVNADAGNFDYVRLTAWASTNDQSGVYPSYSIAVIEKDGDTVTSEGTTGVAVSADALSSIIPTRTSQLTNDSGFLTSIPTASASTLGGVKVGSGLSIDANGVLSATGGGGGSSLPIVNVKDFGATGDGTTDDTRAIQDAADSIQTGGTLFFPEGIYMLATALFDVNTSGTSHALEIYSNQRWIFEEGATLKRGAAAVNHMIFTHNESTAAGYTGAENIEIVGATIDGNKGAYSTAQTPVNLSHSTNVKIIDCIFQNVGSGWHSIEINSSLDTVVEGCIFKDSTNTEDIQLDAAVSSGNLGTSDGTVCKDTHIRNCVFDMTSGVAIGNHTNSTHTNTRIYNNVFRGTPNSSRGYLNFVSNHQKIDVYDNTFYGGAYGVVIPHATKDSTVFNNRFDGTVTPYSGTGITAYTNFINNVLETGDIRTNSEIAIITNTLTNVTTTNDAWIAKVGTSYTATLSVSQAGYIMGSVTVSMNGTDITSTAYDDQTGVISIAAITGDIDIVAIAYDDQYVSVTNTLTDVVNSNTAVITEKNEAYTGTLSAINVEYAIDSVTITMGGVDITSTAYNASTGVITIASATGNIVITATAAEDLTLPANYTRVKQLKSTGTQYIQTDYVTKPTTDLRITDFNTEANSAVNYQTFIGAATADNAADSYEFRCYQKTARLNYTRGNNKSVTTDNAITSATSVRLYNTTLTVDGADLTISNTVIAGSLPLMFFCRNLASAADRLSKAQMGIIKIYEGDTLVKKYIPALDDQNQACYYEKVNGQTLYNSGTGTFDTVPLT